jgi:ribonuclease HII
MGQEELFTRSAVRPGEVEDWCRARGLTVVLGVDEAGRGPLAGPVVAGAVVLDMASQDTAWLMDLDDSKRLDEARREALYGVILERAVATGVAIVEAHQIDEINILQGTFAAMREAIASCCANLGVEPQLVMVDGKMTIPACDRPQQAFIKGDGRSLHIAAASILAKVTRDRLMVDYDAKWPEYGFATHKGYATAAHRRAIADYGPCPIHRLSFAGVREHVGRLRD